MQEAIRQGGRAARRPTRAEIEPAARELVERHGAQIMGTARRYSLSAEDAEDAFQRGLEILLTKAPSTDEDDLVPWLKTVVKHEAFAIRKQRLRMEPAGDRELAAGVAPATHDQAERKERLRLGAEAMSRLKPQEVRCLLLRAEGYSYKQICDETGWTYTKVNRCITEGRRAFVERVAGIESGAECERLAPLLSKLADGEAGAEDLAALRPHLRGCLTCRATLREYRGAPSAHRRAGAAAGRAARSRAPAPATARAVVRGARLARPRGRRGRAQKAGSGRRGHRRAGGRRRGDRWRRSSTARTLHRRRPGPTRTRRSRGRSRWSPPSRRHGAHGHDDPHRDAEAGPPGPRAGDHHGRSQRDRRPAGVRPLARERSPTGGQTGEGPRRRRVRPLAFAPAQASEWRRPHGRRRRRWAR